MTNDKKNFTNEMHDALDVKEPALGRLFKKDGIIYRIVQQLGRTGWVAKEVLDESKLQREVADREKARKLLGEFYDLKVSKPEEARDAFISGVMLGKSPEQIAELISEWNKHTKGAYEH